MPSPHSAYLSNLEQIAQVSPIKDYYLWPRTPMGYDHQDKITQRVGVSDYAVDVEYSRPALIIGQIARLLQRGQLGSNFSVLDIACGDAIVIWQIKRAFPNSMCYGIDCCKGEFGTHDMVQQDGVELFNVFIQHLFAGNSDTPFDIVMMLNTYRGWESADLREHEKDLPNRADEWFSRNGRYTILTASDLQIRHLKKTGFVVEVIGKGEDNSKMAIISRATLVRAFWNKILRVQ